MKKFHFIHATKFPFVFSGIQPTTIEGFQQAVYYKDGDNLHFVVEGLHVASKYQTKALFNKGCKLPRGLKPLIESM